MTAIVTALGLLPLVIWRGAGREIDGLGIHSYIIGRKMEIPARLVRRHIAILLISLLAGNLPAGYASQVPAQPPRSTSASEIRTQVGQIPAGAFVEVRFTDKTKLRGYFSAAEADGFSIRPADAAIGTLRHPAFSDVKSVRLIKVTHTPLVAWVAVGVIAAVVVIAVSIFFIERHNE